LEIVAVRAVVFAVRETAADAGMLATHPRKMRPARARQWEWVMV
jgi:hypothetical protein